MEKKNLIVNWVVVAIMALIIVWTYRFQMKNYASLQLQKENEIKKNAVIETISGLEKKMFAYKKLLFRKEINSLVNTINSIAGQDKIKIESMQPLPEQDKQYYTQLLINLGIKFGSYHELGNFVRDLEKSPDIFNIDVIDITSEESAETQGANSGKELSATLKISTYIYKE